MSALVCQLLYCASVLFKVLCCNEKCFVCVCLLVFMYHLYEKYYKIITVQNYIANAYPAIVLAGYLG